MNSVSNLLSRIKAQREQDNKPFPLWALLAMYERGHSRDLYINYFEGFNLLKDWLKPIHIPDIQHKVHKLHHSYEMQEIAKHLNTTIGHIEYGYQTALIKLLISADFTFMPAQVSTIQDEFTS